MRLGEPSVRGAAAGDAALQALREEAARRIAAEARRRAPVGRTGRLRDSIRVDPADPGEVVSGAWYSSYVERGTSTAAPDPYMQPAIDLIADQMSRERGQ